MSLRLSLSCILLFLCMMTVFCTRQGKSPESGSPDEELLATIPEGFEIEGFRFAPKTRAVLLCYKKKGDPTTSIAVLDGKKLGEFDEVKLLTVAPDGTTIVMLARKDGRDILIADSRKIAEFGVIYERGMTFSHDGKRCVFEALNRHGGETEYFFVISELVGEQPSTICKKLESWREGGLAISDDGSAVAYAKKKGEGMCVVVGENEGEVFPVVSTPVLSSDGKHVAYRAQTPHSGWAVVIDGKIGPAFYDVGPELVFSPDGQTVAYAAKPGPPPEHPPEGGWYLVAGDKRTEKKWEGGVCRGCYISNIAFSPDSERVAFAAHELFSHVVIWDLHADAEEELVEEFDDIWSVRFAPDGKTVVYEAEKSREYFCVAGDKKGEPFAAILTFDLCFKINAKGNVGYLGKQGKDWFVVIDEKKHKFHHCLDESQYPFMCSHISSGNFSVDGSRFEVVIREGSEFWLKSADVR